MPAFICVTCGTQFADRTAPPESCPICTDERQYVHWDGQQWTTLERLRRTHLNMWKRKEEGLWGVGTTPAFGIGQRAILVKGREGNVLWDCIALVDDATRDIVAALGGLSAVAISHPHYYTTMVEWSRAFGDVPIYLHADDREWVMRPDAAIRHWEGETLEIQPGLTLLRCGGHFAGGTTLHWADGANGRGALLAGDIIQVVFDRRHVSFMRSYPNLIPLSAAAVRHIVDVVSDHPFDRLYGAWWHRNVRSDASAAVRRSAERYVAALEEYQ